MVKQELGNLRSYASIAKQNYPELDEEEFFAKLAKGWCEGISKEVVSILGIERGTQVLDPWQSKLT